jgi:hypothetical protein
MKVLTDSVGAEYLEVETIEEIKCIRFIEKAIVEEIIRINPMAMWAVRAVEAVLDEEGDGIVGYPQSVYVERPA